MKIGICFGGYCPMHRGHLDAIMQAKKENDICYVVVCGYDNEPRGNEINLPLNKRYQLVKEFFKNDEIVHVLKVNDTELGIDESMSRSNWEIWLNCVGKQIEHNLNGINYWDDHKFTIYVAEKSYAEDLDYLINQTEFFKYQFVCNKSVKYVLLPKTINVSGTACRKNPIKYWNYIVPTYRRFLTKNILIIGTASEGKTTLVRDIAKYFDIPHVEEYGREYMENRAMKDTDLTCHDFTEFLIHQRNNLLRAEEQAGNGKGIVLSDTDNLITLMYAKAYAKDPNISFTEEEYQNLKDLVGNHLIHGIYWDHIFMIPPGNKFVDDGSRYMEQSSIEERRKNYVNLCDLIQELCSDYYDKITYLKPGDYYNNFLTVKNYINCFYEE